MSLLKSFELASGSVTGRHHIKELSNNQDALLIDFKDDYIFGVVCDGCGSAPQSEIGASIGTHLVRRSILKKVIPFRKFDDETCWKRVTDSISSRILNIINEISPDTDTIISNMFMFTIVGFIIFEDSTYVFNLGDGLININGNNNILPRIQGNYPPYIAYRIVEHEIEIDDKWKEFNVEKFDTKDINTLIVGTDGACDYLRLCENFSPDSSKNIDTFEDLCSDDSVFYNRNVLDRKLRVLNREKSTLVNNELIVEKPLLPDDTTLIIARRIVRDVL